MSDIGPVKVSKKKFQQLNRLAIKRKYNRAIMPAFFKKVTDKDEFLVHPWLVHEHAQGQMVEPHLRCQVLFCTGGVVGLSVGFLDIPFKSYPKQKEAKDE